MNLQAFGEQLQTMRKRAGLSQERLADTLDQAARAGVADEYRVVDGTPLASLADPTARLITIVGAGRSGMPRALRSCPPMACASCRWLACMR